MVGFRQAKDINKDAISVGIDIQTDGIALALKQKTGGKSTLKCDFMPIQSEQDIPALLKEAVSKYRLKKQPATILLPPSQYSLLQTSSPSMSRDELRAAARWKITDLLSYPAESAVVDIFEYPQAGQRGAERMLYVVASNKVDVQRSVDWVRESDLTLKAIDIGEFALRNVVHHLQDNETGAIVLSLSEHTGLLVFVKQDEIYLTRRLDVGFADLLLGDEKVSEEIILELQRSLDFFESQFAQAMPSKLLIYPPDKLSGDLTQQISTQLHIQVEPLILERLNGYKLDADEESQSRCLLAVGAALREEQGQAA